MVFTNGSIRDCDKQVDNINVIKKQRMLVVFYFFIYVTHILINPYMPIVANETLNITIFVVKILLLITTIILFSNILYETCSLQSLIHLFNCKKHIKSAVFLFWITRSLIVEILKGQVVYSFANGTTKRNAKDSMYVKTVTAELEFTNTPEAQQKGKERMEEYLDLWS